jgi:2-polyprenyl-3-methyl-5-hydroxy-6-metoxy-1,4-benzoquinol methylase
MIAYAACVGDPEKFRGICLPGLSRVAAPDDLLIEAEHERSIFAAYNEVLDAVCERDDLEALVLLHEDTEVTDPMFADLVRRHVADPEVAVVGAVGARDISGLAWWEGRCFGRVDETRGTIDFGGGTHDVHTVDGLVMALSPWAVRNLRFDDEAYEGFDAYDADFCAQARAAGKRVVVTELPVVHRHTRVGSDRADSDGGSFERNQAVFRAKWLTGGDADGAPAPPAPAPAASLATSAAGVRDSHGDEAYFEHTRPELRALVPFTARRILDVGCGAGALGAALKDDRDVEVVGLEGFPEAAARARERLDDALCVDLDALEALPPGTGTFDAIVFGDVLEHLLAPERLVSALLPSLAPDGVVVLSIPNVKHWTVLYPLLVQDRWTYEDAGLLDRTHVHFFTIEEAGAMLARQGLEVAQLGINDHAPLPPQMVPLTDTAAALGADPGEAAARLGAYQYLVVARRAASPLPVPAPPVTAGPGVPATPADLRALVAPGAERVLDLAAELGPDLGSLEALPPGAGPYDAILVRDALEHVRDPARLLRAVVPALAPDGVLICAVPNVKHWSVVEPLLVNDRWSYGDTGLLARDHLRFFTLDEVSDLLDDAGLEGVDVVPNESAPLPDELAPLVDVAVRFGAEREETRLRLGAYEYLVVARPRALAA